MNEHVERYAAHVNPTFVRLLGTWNYGRVWTRAEGCWLYDRDGAAYLDLLSGFGSMPLGHNPAVLHEAMADFARSARPSVAHFGVSPEPAQAAEALAGITPGDLDLALFATSGAEAVEAGLKIAIAATKRGEVLSCEGGFHGTNLGVLPLMGKARMRQPFAVRIGEGDRVPFGDLEALERALSGRTIAAFVVEPVQVEGGINLAPEGYLEGALALCRRFGTLLVMDEVQTGLGRTGRWFATNVVPDVLVLGKALGGGVLPVSAAMVSPALFKRAYGSLDRFDLHGSTYAGYGLGCAVACAVLDGVATEGLCDRAQHIGTVLTEGLSSRLAGHPFIREIRGVGALVGVEIGPTDAGWVSRVAPGLVRNLSEQLFGQWTALKLLEAGVVAQPASHRWDVLRLEPALVLSDEELTLAVDRVASVFEAFPTLTGLLTDITKRTTRQAVGGFALR